MTSQPGQSVAPLVDFADSRWGDDAHYFPSLRSLYGDAASAMTYAPDSPDSPVKPIAVKDIHFLPVPSAEAPAAAASEEEWNKRAEESPTLKRVKRDLSGRELLPAHRTPDIGQGKDLSVVAAHACGHRGCINFISHCFYASNGEDKRHRTVHRLAQEHSGAAA